MRTEYKLGRELPSEVARSLVALASLSDDVFLAWYRRQQAKKLSGDFKTAASLENVRSEFQQGYQTILQQLRLR